MGGRVRYINWRFALKYFLWSLPGDVCGGTHRRLQVPLGASLSFCLVAIVSVELAEDRQSGATSFSSSAGNGI